MNNLKLDTKNLIQENHILVKDIVNKLGVHPNTAYAWQKGTRSPSREDFEKLKKLGNTESPNLESKVVLLERRLNRLQENLMALNSAMIQLQTFGHKLGGSKDELDH